MLRDSVASVLKIALIILFVSGSVFGVESKKGLQVQMVDDALALGVRHAAINVNLVQMEVQTPSPENTSITFEGQRFEFNQKYLAALDSSIKPLLKHGVTIYLIILAYNTPDAKLAAEFIHPKFNAASKAPISAFKIDDEAGARRFQAYITYLGWRYATPEGQPVHFIVGNEVDSHWAWYNMGEASADAVIEEYEHAVRLCHEATRAFSATSRVYLSLDHYWTANFTPNEPLKSMGSRLFLEKFAKRAKLRGDFNWNVAYHPYPENLFEPRWWNDKTPTMKFDSPRVTFKNLELLNEFMKRPEMLYEGQRRRIILSEQGFHTANTPDGEKIQAAAYAYAYKKVEQIDGIDAFILHRHVDHKMEGGLLLGLWASDAVSRPTRKKLMYDVFRLADTPQWEEAFKFALPIVGLKSWDDVKLAPVIP